MVEEYRTIANAGFGEYVEKKSRFIGAVYPAKDLAEAEGYLQAARKKYYDARHNCFACIVGEPGTPMEILRSNDDGEPGGTAGKPMLEILRGEELHCAAAVVTRYFGGTLLGTGGLVRAYSEAVRRALDTATIATVRVGVEAHFLMEYAAAGRVRYLLEKEGFPQPELIYGQDVEVVLCIPASALSKIRQMLTEATDGLLLEDGVFPVRYLLADGRVSEKVRL